MKKIFGASATKAEADDTVHWLRLKQLPILQALVVGLIAATFAIIIGCVAVFLVEAWDTTANSTGKISNGMVATVTALSALIGGIATLVKFMYTTMRETDYGAIEKRGEADALVAAATKVQPAAQPASVTVAGNVGEVTPGIHPTTAEKL